MYSREFGDDTLTFEASGGLIHASLVMQDKETSSYWAIMRGRAIAGDHAGAELRSLPTGTKMTWQAWRREHPRTLVLSIDGYEHAGDAYRSYFDSPRGFNGIRAKDRRLPTKALVYAFDKGGIPHAVAHALVEDGYAASAADDPVFFYRRPDAADGESTLAFLGSAPFERDGAGWVSGDCRFRPAERAWQGVNCPQRLSGFDTYWYNWSLSNPSTVLLKPANPRRSDR